MKLPSLSEQIKRAGEDIEKWRKGELEFVTRVFTVPEAPELSPDDIKRIREGLNMNQAQFGRLLHVARRTVERWEQGTRTPRPGQARQIDLCSQPRWIEFWRLEDPPDAERPPTEKTETSAPVKPRSRTKAKSSAKRTRTVAATAPKSKRPAQSAPGRAGEASESVDERLGDSQSAFREGERLRAEVIRSIKGFTTSENLSREDVHDRKKTR